MFPESSFRLTGQEEHIESGLGFVGAKLHTHTERVGSRGVARGVLGCPWFVVSCRF